MALALNRSDVILSTPEASLLSAATWSDRAVTLKDFPSSYPVPGLAMIVKGRYRSIGSIGSGTTGRDSDAAATTGHAGTSGDASIKNVQSNSSDINVSNVVFIQEIQRSQKVLMESVKLHPGGRHVILTGRKFSLPLTYRGWFEVLSEDGRPCQPLVSVAQLAHAWPAECVVRESIRALVSGPPSRMSASATRLEQTRVVQAGEKLALYDEVKVNVEAQPGKSLSSSLPARRYLRCIDESGNTVFLNFEQKLNVSPVAGPDNISGMHTIVSLLDKFRLPLTVHLTFGFIPPKVDKSFTSIFRLIGIYEDETAFVLPLRSVAQPVPEAGSPATSHGVGRSKNSASGRSSLSQSGGAGSGRMMTVSTREPLMLVGAVNANEISSLPEFDAIERRCASMVAGYGNSIHLLISGLLPDTRELARGAERLRSVQDTALRQMTIPERGSRNTSGRQVVDADGASTMDDEEVDIMYDEIEGIYRYVRDGGEPPPPISRPLRAVPENVVVAATPDVNLRQQGSSSPASEPVMTQGMPTGIENKWIMTSTMDITDDTYDVHVGDLGATNGGNDVNGARSVGHTTAGERSDTTGNVPLGQSEVHDYCWEEPIYADIEQIRERKRQSVVVQTAGTVSGERVGGSSVGNWCNDNSEKPEVSEGTPVPRQEAPAPVIGSTRRPPVEPRPHRENFELKATAFVKSDDDMLPVGNLRQLIKHFSMLEASAAKRPTSMPPTAASAEVAPQPPADAKTTTTTAKTHDEQLLQQRTQSGTSQVSDQSADRKLTPSTRAKTISSESSDAPSMHLVDPPQYSHLTSVTSSNAVDRSPVILNRSAVSQSAHQHNSNEITTNAPSVSIPRQLPHSQSATYRSDLQVVNRLPFMEIDRDASNNAPTLETFSSTQYPLDQHHLPQQQQNVLDVPDMYDGRTEHVRQPNGAERLKAPSPMPTTVHVVVGSGGVCDDGNGNVDYSFYSGRKQPTVAVEPVDATAVAASNITSSSSPSPSAIGRRLDVQRPQTTMADEQTFSISNPYATVSALAPVQGTTAVLVSRSRPRLLQQHQHRALAASTTNAPLGYTTPSHFSQTSYVGIGGGSSFVVLPPAAIGSEQTNQPNRGSAIPEVDGNNITRISTLSRRHGGESKSHFQSAA